MNRYRFFLALVCLVVFLCLGNENRADGQSTGSIAGVVTLPDSTNPVGIAVAVIGQNKSAETDSSGTFSLDGVTTGSIRLQAGKLGYANVSVDTVLSASQTLTLALQLSSSIRDTEAIIQTSSFLTAIANEGNIGAVNKFVDSNETGFKWLGVQQLKEASLMIGVDTTRVSDAARFLLGIAQNNLDHDFQSLSDVVIRTAGPDSVVCFTSFDDSRSNFPPGIPSQPLGIRVIQETDAFPKAPDDGYLIVKLTIDNTTSIGLENLLVGYFVDWDVQPTPDNNRGSILQVQNQIPGLNGDQPFVSEIAMQKDATSGTRFMGVVPLSQPQFKAARIASVQQEIAPTGQNTGLTEANKYLYMRDRRSVYDTTDVGIEEDLAMVVSLGDSNGGAFNTSSFSLLPHSSITVGFGFVGASDSLQFINNALEAQRKWVSLGNGVHIITAVHGRRTGLPEDFRLEQNYPNPFNPSTLIRYSLPRETYVSLRVFNLLGQEVETLDRGLKPPGDQSVRFDAGDLPGGIYFYRLTAGTFSDVKKMVLVK